MSSSPFEKIILEADTLARQNSWQEAYKKLALADELNPNDPGVVNGMGTCLLQLGQLVNSLSFFQRAAALAPDSPDAYNNVGVAYAMAGNLVEAEKAYQKAVSIDPNHTPTWKNLALVYLRQDRMVEGVQILAAVVKTNPRDVEALSILAELYEEGKDYVSAKTLYQTILNTQPGNPQAVQALARLAETAPTLERIARPEHAKKLAALKGLTRTPAQVAPPSEQTLHPDRDPQIALAFYGPAELSTEMRLGVIGSALASQVNRVKFAVKFNPEDLDQYNTFVFANPQVCAMGEAVEKAARAGRRVILDIDRDFHQIPADEVAYNQVGPGNPASLKALETALSQADLVTVPNAALADQVRKYARVVEVMPNGWAVENVLWNKPSSHRSSINIGLLSTHVAQKDAELLTQDIARLLRAEPRVLLVIGGDPELYAIFSKIAQSRCLFLPPGRAEDYPYLLANFDILLVPLRNTPFNQSHSDQPLMEAGIRRIPWVATPVSAFQEWGAGGLFAAKNGDWSTTLKQLVHDPALRQELGEAGRKAAEERESSHQAARWLQALSPF